jgi:RNA polymerase sigma-70 factor (ECF subfamily)
MNVAFVNTTDEHLFNKIKEDDEKAFDLLFRKYYTQLCRFAFTYLKDKDQSEEMVQEVFITIWNNRKKITINTSLSSYLYRAVKNHSLNYIKKNSRQQFVKIENISEPDIIEDVVTDEKKFAELEKKYKEALEFLPAKCKEIFLMSRNHHLKYKEIAEKLDISIKTVEAQMSIAFKKLREELKSFA